MDRRSYLRTIAVAVAGIAGCTSSDTRNQSTDTATTAPTTDTTTSVDTSTATESATETEAATQTTSQPQPDAATEIKRTRRALTTALQAYTGSDDPDLTTVTATTSSFQPSPVDTALTDAEDALTAAKEAETTDKQSKTIGRLTGIHSFLSRSTTAQAAVCRAYTALKTAQSALQNENPTEAQSASFTMRTAVTDTLKPVSDLQRERNQSDTDALTALSRGEYSTKIQQLAGERRALNGTEGLLARVIQGVKSLVAARTSHRLGEYSDAVEQASNAERVLEAASEDLGEHAAGVSYSVTEGVLALESTAASKADAAAHVGQESADKLNG